VGVYFCLAMLTNGPLALASPVVLISIDGLRPTDIANADQQRLKIPNLRKLMAEGVYATGVKGVLPTLTYPSHTTLLSGVSPAQHGIGANLTFDPFSRNQQGWYWYASDIRVPTIWDAARSARITTANVHWPVTVGAPIDINLPQFWRTGHADDRKLMAALATPGLLESLQAELGPYADGIDESIEADETRGRFAAQIIRERKPGFMTIYFAALDHEEHVAGVDSPTAKAVLERIDALVGDVVLVARKIDPSTVIAVVSDHGFAPLEYDVNLYGAFIKAGLIVLDDKGKIKSWEATPWYASGSAPIVMREPGNTATRERVKKLLDQLAADQANGIDRILDRTAIARYGGTKEAEFFVLFKPGFEIGADPTAAMVVPSKLRGMHGYAPDVSAMNATFLMAGTGIPAHRSLGEIDMRDIAPTLAHVLGVRFAGAEGKDVVP
jgi:hypothetical protein